ncbi:MAG: DUF1549 and DUF1553 domain-containing protein [Verrucomicrobiales bacterium]
MKLSSLWKRFLAVLLIGLVAETSPAREPKQIAANKLWSIQPLIRPAIPSAGGDWALNPIDHFIAEKLEGAGIRPCPTTTPAVLARRLHFDLHGLPPKPRSILSLRSAKPPAYANLVGELLDSPRFGERWARYWLDIARFAESTGYEQDQDRPHAWPYRNWVIKAFNEDLPYDEFVRLQVAGDHLRAEDPEAAVATGFLVAGVESLIQSRKDFVQQRYDKIDDMIGTVGTAFLGMSFSCARCHDHMYDPFTQRDYYALASTLETTVSRDRELKSGKAFVAGEAPGGKITMLVVTEPHRRNLPSIPAKVHFLDRGDPSQQLESMNTSFPAALVRNVSTTHWCRSQEKPVHGRVALAHWITDLKHGAGSLLARVIVNRLWQHHFGSGLVTTPNNFGSRGTKPTHPELIEWLASELVLRKWKLKEIHKLIVMSATYRQGYRSLPLKESNELKGNELADPKNNLWWRREPRRLDAEAIRDNFLAVSDRLELKIFGPGTHDPNSTRRSIYLFQKRSKLIPLLQLFDAPDTLQSEGQRQLTTTAPQALMLMNNPFVNSAANSLGSRLHELKLDPEATIRHGFLLALGREATAVETSLCQKFMANGSLDSLRDFAHMLFCLNEFIHVE